MWPSLVTIFFFKKEKKSKDKDLNIQYLHVIILLCYYCMVDLTWDITVKAEPNASHKTRQQEP